MIPSVRKRGTKEVEISMTNLVDVVFVLLIFFVLTTTFTKETGLDISKPSADAASEVSKEPFIISVTREGALYVQERQLDLGRLGILLQKEGARDPEQSVLIVSDEGTNMGVVVQILNECNIAGLKKVSVSAEKG